jgi:hypothetical protein
VFVKTLRVETPRQGLRSGTPWHIQACCATSGDGLYDGMDWLAGTLAAVCREGRATDDRFRRWPQRRHCRGRNAVAADDDHAGDDGGGGGDGDMPPSKEVEQMQDSLTGATRASAACVVVI